jgi:hypothetical protein
MEGLSKLTDSLLPIIVLVVIAGARILTTLRRRARNRDQSQDTAGPAAIPVAEPEAPDDDDDEAFSAWSLSVHDEPVPEPAPAAPPKAADAAPSLFTALSAVSSVQVSGEIPAWLQPTPQPIPPAESQPTELLASAAAVMEARTPETGDEGTRPLPAYRRNPVGSVESRIRSLPPLQQGVVWAEILGTPKGL